MFVHYDTKELTLNDSRLDCIRMTLSSEMGRLSIRVEGPDNSCTINIKSEDDLKRLKDFIDEHLASMPKKSYLEKGMEVGLFNANGRIETESEEKLTNLDPKNYSYEKLYGLFQQKVIYALYKLYEGISDDKVREVVDYCINRQIKFVLTGDTSFSQKMTLKDVSDALKVDVATVSRCTKTVRIYSPCGKTFTLDNGTCSLKEPSLFDDGIKWNGKDVSRLEVLDVIQNLIEREEGDRPLGDDELCEKLKERGYEISRRTVAKYREEFLGIPNSNKRRQGLWKKPT